MSYCRTSCPEGSDVYVFGSLRTLECHLAYDAAVQAGIEKPYFGVPYDSPAPEKTMIGHLIWVRSRGLRVPEHAIDSLLSDAVKRDLELSQSAGG